MQHSLRTGAHRFAVRAARIAALISVFLQVGTSGQCVDTDSECMSMAMRGECQSNFEFMAVSCKAACGLCGMDGDAIARAQTFERQDGDFDAVPLLFHGKDGSETAQPAPELVESDAQIRIYQPLLAEHCCFGATASVRYEVSGSIKVPEDGVVVFTFEGYESDAMPFSRGEFAAFVRQPGNYSVLIAIDDHEKTRRFAQAHAVLVVAAQADGTPWTELAAALESDQSTGSSGRGPAVLRHALAGRAGSEGCGVQCVGTEAMEEVRAAAAEAIDAATPGRSPFLLQIGACDGESFDPVSGFLKRFAWHALLVEPLPDIFQRLQRTYQGFPNVKLANVAVTRAGQECVMLRVPADLVDDGDVPDWAVGIASFFSDRTAVGGVGTDPRDYETFADKVRKEEVSCVTMAELLTAYAVPHVDYLQIDAEGYDAFLLSEVDLDHWQPRAVAIETINLQAAELLGAYRSLALRGFAILSDGRDLLAVRPAPQTPRDEL